MASVVRYLVTVVLAAFITLSAFYLMHRLIDHDAAGPSPQPAVTSIHFGPVDIPEPSRKDPREKPDKPERQEPPPDARVIAETTPIEKPLDIERALRPDPNATRVYEGTFPPLGNGSDSQARPVSAVPPPYPRKAALDGVEGWVRVAVEIDERGRVRNVEVLAAEPGGVFDQAAVNAVRRWSWKPAIVDGQPRAQRVIQELTFDLDDA
jgi:protein TonB